MYYLMPKIYKIYNKLKATKSEFNVSILITLIITNILIL
jgi:hypothetical protein